MSKQRRDPANAPIGAIAAIGVCGVVAGAAILAGTPIGADWSRLPAAVAAQLPATMPATLLVLAATGLQLGAGSVVARAVLARPFGSLAELAIAGFTTAIVLDFLGVAILGAIDAWRWPVVLALHAVLIVSGLALRSGLSPFVDPGWRRPPPWGLAAWAFVLIVWSGPLLFQLGAPVVSFNDVPANHVAPAEHIRAYGSLDPLDTSPSPRYSASRNFLGYLSFHGTLSTLTDLAAARSVVAFVIPLTLITGLATHRTASLLFGHAAGFWALVMVPLTFVFLRLPDSRATATVFPIALYALAALWQAPPAMHRREYVVVGAALGAAILVHPLVGAFAWATAAVLVVLWPDRYAGNGLPALTIAAILALPQAAIMIGLTLPSIAVVLPVVWAAAAAFLLEPIATRSGGWRFATGRRIAAAIALIAALALAPGVASGIGGGVAEIVGRFPLLSISAVAAAAITLRRPGSPLVGAALGTWFVGIAVLSALPLSGPLAESLRFEVPKTYGYWVPLWLALFAAAGIAAALDRGAGMRTVASAVVAVLVAVAALPLRPGVVHISDWTEHRLSESLSISARHAIDGYWQGYPDARYMIGASGREVVAFLRQEQLAGRLNESARVLHLADYQHEWEQIPIGVFTGAIETLATLEPDRSIHTDAARQLHVDEVGAVLGPTFRYVVLEPAGLPDPIRGVIESRGYRPIFSNDSAVIYGFDAAGASASSSS